MYKKNNLLLSKKLILRCIVAFVLILLYWVWLFLTTTQADARNTYNRCETISSIELFLESHRGTDKLLLHTENSCYLLNTGWRNEDRTMNLYNKLTMIDTPVNLKIWKHISKFPFDFRTQSIVVEEVVDLRVDNEVFLKIEDHNNYQRSERYSGVLGGIFFFTLPIVVYIVLMFKINHK